ncbi:MAG TPA: hypothetical protein DCZ13_13110 [Porticoccaceae bacterium]|nr:hypothetical protein [Porticoccaceae bacterium]
MSMTDQKHDDSGGDSKPDYRGAAVINEDGSETPITEDMVRDACDEIETGQADESSGGAQNDAQGNVGDDGSVV